MDENTKNLIFQIEHQNFIINKLGTEAWLNVYRKEKTEFDDVLYWCRLIPDKLVEKALSTANWEMPRLADGLPYYNFTSRGKIYYHRYNNSDGIEPLIIMRSFHGLKPEYPEVCEEFRYFHNLFPNVDNNKYLKINASGDEEEIIQVEPDSIKVKLKEIKEFLNVKAMSLAIYFSIKKYLPYSFEEMGKEPFDQPVKRDNIYYEVFGKNTLPDANSSIKSISIILGKKLIRGNTSKKKKDKPQYADFIVGIDENGTPITNTCDPFQLPHQTKDSPNFLSKIFFRKEVLSKYYSDSEKYSVKDGYLDCGQLWGIPIDNNHPNYVVVYLGDIGRHLPYNEQLYWKSFNVPPEGSMSSVSFRRNILVEYAEPERNDLLFKSRFQSFQEDWTKKFGWSLFLPLVKDDEHYFNGLRIPLNNSLTEFEPQVLALTKILVDSLNEEKIENSVVLAGHQIPKEVKGSISKFELFLSINGVANQKEILKFLRNLQEVRSKRVAHRKSRDLQKIIDELQIGKKELNKIFEEFLENAISLLEFLRKHFNL